MCEESPITDWLGPNHKLRFLAGCYFDHKMAFDELERAENWRYENGCDTITVADV